MKTTEQAERLLNTRLGKFPLVDPLNFAIYYANNKNILYRDVDIGTYYENDAGFQSKLNKYIFDNFKTLNDDNDFNIIEAKNVFDYYLKVIYRNVSLYVFMDNIEACVNSLIRPEMEQVENAMDKICEEHKFGSNEYNIAMSPLTPRLETLKEYNLRLENFSLRIINFSLKSLDGDLNISSYYAKDSAYPKTIKLRECKGTLAMQVF